jgi:hypothetical protein
MSPWQLDTLKAYLHWDKGADAKRWVGYDGKDFLIC